MCINGTGAVAYERRENLLPPSSLIHCSIDVSLKSCMQLLQCVTQCMYVCRPESADTSLTCGQLDRTYRGFADLSMCGACCLYFTACAAAQIQCKMGSSFDQAMQLSLNCIYRYQHRHSLLITGLGVTFALSIRLGPAL